MNTKRITDDNKSYVQHVSGNLARLKQQQIENVDKGFDEIIKKMQDKRELLKKDFEERYSSTDAVYLEKENTLVQNASEVTNIESIYDELRSFIERNSDAKVLSKISDISSFMNKSIEDLERITKMRGFEK